MDKTASGAVEVLGRVGVVLDRGHGSAEAEQKGGVPSVMVVI